MENKTLICIGCPMGCSVDVVLKEGVIVSITGYSCKKGKEYAAIECIRPVRILTTTVEVAHGTLEVASVKSQYGLPKDMLMDCIKELKKVKLQAPVCIGDIVSENILNTGINIIATSNIEKAGSL